MLKFTLEHEMLLSLLFIGLKQIMCFYLKSNMLMFIEAFIFKLKDLRHNVLAMSIKMGPMPLFQFKFEYYLS